MIHIIMYNILAMETLNSEYNTMEAAMYHPQNQQRLLAIGNSYHCI